jgi:hypothetical protein
MTIATNIDIKQKLQTSSSPITKPEVTPNHLKFGEKVHLSANGTPIKTFSNWPYSFIDPTIFPETRLQFNVPTVKINYPIFFNPKVSHNISSYKAGSNIPAENIPIFIYCDTVIDSNKNESTYIVNLESNFFTTSPLSTSSADLLPPSLEKSKRTKINASRMEEILSDLL